MNFSHMSLVSRTEKLRKDKLAKARDMPPNYELNIDSDPFPPPSYERTNTNASGLSTTSEN
jgi:hypothetical protein